MQIHFQSSFANFTDEVTAVGSRQGIEATDGICAFPCLQIRFTSKLKYPVIENTKLTLVELGLTGSAKIYNMRESDGLWHYDIKLTP